MFNTPKDAELNSLFVILSFLAMLKTLFVKIFPIKDGFFFNFRKLSSGSRKNPGGIFKCR